MSPRDYFSLWTDSPVLGGSGVGRIRQPLFFSGVLLGALGQAVFDYYREGKTLGVGELVIAIIASLVTFPWVYYRAGLNRVAQMSFAKWCVSFQYGFFWPVILKVIEKALGG